MLEQQTILELLDNSTFICLPEGFELASSIQNAKVNGDHIHIEIILPFPANGIKQILADEIEAEIMASWPQTKKIAVEIKHRLIAYETKAGVPHLAKIKNF